jgi:hypothetical protein
MLEHLAVTRVDKRAFRERKVDRKNPEIVKGIKLMLLTYSQK